MMRDGGSADRDRSQFSPDASHDASKEDAHSANGITVADSHFRFDAALQRAGDDLRLTGSDGKIDVVSGYHKSEHPSALWTPHSTLSADLVAALAGPGESGKHAAPNAPHPAMQVIGRAIKIEGHVSVVRNGVAVTLNNGDVLLKGDVIQTDGDGVAGLVFKDGSVFQIGHDSRFVLTEFNYDPHGSANLEVFNLVRGSFTFASGAIAHAGDMRLGTPVASAKITGSAGDIAVDDGAVTLSIFHQDDGLHQATVLDQNGDPVTTISSDGGKLTLTPTGPSQFAADERAKTDADKAFELDALNGILQIKNLAGHLDGSTSIGMHGSSFAAIGSNDQAQGTASSGPDGAFAYAPLLDGAFHRSGDSAPGFPPVTAPVTVGPTNHPPALDLHAGPAPLAALEQTPVKIMPLLTLSDTDSTTLLQADVKITGNFEPGEDVLSFANTASIHGSYDPGTGVLTLRAVAGQSPTLADFQAALRTVTYTDTSDAPSTLPRTLTVTVQDPDGAAHGGHDLASASMTLSVTKVNDAPALTLDETSVVALEQTATVVAPALSLLDIDSATLDHATVQITGNYLRGEDVLSFANTAHIQGSFDPASGTLTLTARAGQSPTLADFEAALRSVTYTDTSDNPSPLARTLTVTVQDPDGTADGGHDTAVHSISLTVTPVNDPPAIIGETDPGAVLELPDAHAQSVGPIAGTLSASDLDIGDTLTGHVAAPATASFSGGALPAGVDLDALRDVAAISFDATTTTSSGGANTLTWTYHPAAANLDWLAAGETLTITYLAEVTDGTASVGSQPLTITITGSNDAPTIVAAQAAGTVTEDVAVDAQGRLQAAGHIDFTDPDRSDTHSASVVFVSTTDPGGVALGDMSPQISTETANGIGGQAAWSYHVDNNAVQFLAAGQSVVETYRVTILDGHGGTATQDVSVTIVGANDAPVVTVAHATGSVTEDTAVDPQGQLHVGGTIDFTDVDLADTHTVSVDLVSSTNAGGVALGTMNPQLTADTTHGLGGEVAWSYHVDNGSVQFLRAGQSVTEIYALSVSDGHGGLATQNVTVTITGTEDAPVLAAGGSGATIEAADAAAQDIAPITGTLSVTDSDVGDALTASIVGSPAVTLDGHAFSLPAGAASLIDNALSFQHGVTSNGGAAEINWSYDPSAANLDFLRQGQLLVLTYTVGVSDGLRDSSPQTISISITGTNDLPTITGSAAAVDEAVDAHAQAISLGGVISVTDLDVGDTLTASVMGSPSVNLDGHAFTLPPGAAALIDSTVLSFDNSGHLSNGGATSIAWTYQPGDANLDFLKQGQTLTLTYAVTVNDGTGSSAPQNVTITINGTNDAPVAVADSYTTAEDTPLLIPLAGVLANDADADGDALSAIVVTGPAHGTLALNADGSFSYTPSADYNGVDSFAYKANDGLADSNAATVSITVTPVNDPAIISGVSSGAVTEAGGVNNAAAGTPTAIGTLTDTDVDNPANTFTAVGTAAPSDGGYGTYTMTSAGVWTYTINNGNSAVQALNVGGTLTDTFTVTTIDGTAQVVTVTINGANDAAVLSADTVNLTETNAVLSTSGTLTISDVDSPATFVAQASTVGLYGTFAIAANGAWTYVASSAHDEFVGGQTYTDRFAVTSADGTTSSVTIKILGTDDAAVISGVSSGSVVEAGGVSNGTAGTPTATGTLAISDVDSPAGTFTAVAAATASTGGYGTYTMTSGGMWTYTLDNSNATVQALNVGATLTDTFTVTTTGGVTQVVTIAIAGADDAPVVSGDVSASLLQGLSTTITTADLNVTDVDNAASQLTFNVSATVHGYVALSSAPGVAISGFTQAQLAAGAVIFVNDATQNPSASFTVSATDGSLTTAPVTVNVAVSSDFVIASNVDLGGVSETINSLSQSSGTLTGTGTLTDANAANFTGGTESGGGATIVNGGATFFNAGNQTFTVDGRTLELHGSAQSGAFAGDTLHLNNDAVLKIDAGVTFTDASASGTAFNISSSAGAGTVNVAGSYEKTGGGTTAISTALTNTGTIDAKAGTLDLAGSVSNTGTLKAEGGGTLLVAGNVSGTGAVIVGNDGTVEFGANVGAGQTVTFSGSPGTLTIDHPANFSGTIAGFSAATDAIDLVGINHNSAQFAQSFNASTGVLTVTDGTNSASLHFSGPTFGFAFATDSAGTGTVIKPANVYTVHNAAELNTALLAVSVGGSASAANSNYSIEFAANISIASLGANLTAINLASGSHLVINGAGYSLDGANAYRGLFVFGGNVDVNNLNIANTLAQGGAGGVEGGGGGAGLGGGLFVAAGAAVTIDAVTFTGDLARGGAGGSFSNGSNVGTGGGGGGMGTAGSSGFVNHGYSGFYVTEGDPGGTLGLTVPGHANYVQSAAGGKSTGGFGSLSAGADGGFGGGGGGGAMSTQTSASGSSYSAGGHGGFGGGGGAAGAYSGSNLVGNVGGIGGFGGGGGRSAGGQLGAAGGFGAGNGGGVGPGTYGAGGGGGLGAGGAVFVQQGGSLTIAGGAVSGNSVTGGLGDHGGGNGQALGSGIFIQGNQGIVFAPGAGESAVISDLIADQGGNGGSGHVEIAGTGTVHFAAANTYVGGTTIDSGSTLKIEAGGSTGTGAIIDNGTLRFEAPGTIVNAISDNSVLAIDGDGTFEFQAAVTGTGTFNFTQGHAITAVFDTGVPTATIKGFDVGDTVDLRSVAATSYTLDSNNVLTLKSVGGATVATLHLDPTQHFDSGLGLVADGHGGTNVRLALTSFTVSTAAELNAALTAVSQGGTAYGSNLNYTIHFAANISLASLASSQLAAINLASGSSLTIDGAGFTLDGAGTHRGFFESAGNVTLENLTIANMLAQGGDGGIGGGGGGAGLGGGLFVGTGASATLANVAFKYDAAHGGAGGGVGSHAHFLSAGGGGGGMGTAGVAANNVVYAYQNRGSGVGYKGGAGGGLGLSNLSSGAAPGGTPTYSRDPLPNTVAPSGGFGGGGGGGAAYNFGTTTRDSAGGQGGFGGGGGAGAGVSLSTSASYADAVGGNGGFGGGGGGGIYSHSNIYTGAHGGFGGGNGGIIYTHGQKSAEIGGGGLGAGGGVFVQDGGSLTIESGSLAGGSTVGGAAGPGANTGFDFTTVGLPSRPVATAGQGLGSGIFLQGNETLTLAPASGATVTIADAIADQGGNGGHGAVDIRGLGTVEFDSANTYSGGTMIEAGATLKIAGQGSVGTGLVTDNGDLNFTRPTTVASAINDNGAVDLGFHDGNAVFSGAVALTGSLNLGTGANEADFNGGLTGSGSINFGSGGQTLKITGAMPGAVVHGFGVGDTIDLASISATGIGSFVNNVLSLVDAGGATVATINFDPAQQNLAPHGFLLTPDGSGGTAVELNELPVFHVASATALARAIAEINVGGVFSQPNQNYEIDIVGDFSLDQMLPVIKLASGDTLTVQGQHHTISGAVDGVPTYSGFDLESGSAAINDLTIADFVAHGTDGGSPASTSIQGGGGGGLGAGGGLFIGSGASVTLTDVAFSHDQAIGGSGGRGGTYHQGSVLGLGRFSLYGPDDNSRGAPSHAPQTFGYGGYGGNKSSGGGNGSFGGGGGGGGAGYYVNGYHRGGGNGGSGGYGGGAGGHGAGTAFGGNSTGGGGGGAGLGGAVFVSSGGHLYVSDWNFSNNQATGGAGGTGGQGIGNDLFSYHGTVGLTSGLGQTITANQLIAGQTGTFNVSGAGNVVLAGGLTAGTLNITGSTDVSVLTSINIGNINLSGSGDVLLQGAFTGHDVINNQGTGTLTVKPIYNVSTTAELAAAIQAIDSNPIVGVPINYVINLTADLTLNALLPILTVATGDTLVFEGNGHVIDGGNTFGGFYLRSGNASFSDLTMQHLLERGQDGGFSLKDYRYGGNGGGGGGGLGAGGALFIGSGASATISNVNVVSNSAIGGNGGSSTWRYAKNAFAGGGGALNGNGYQSGGTGGGLRSPYHGGNGGFGGGGGGGYGISDLGYHSRYVHPAAYDGGLGGYGAGNGGNPVFAGYNPSDGQPLNFGGGGGGGAGLGGGIFVGLGGSLTIAGGETFSGNYVHGGSGGSSGGGQDGGNGQGLGAGLFAASNNVTLAPDAGKTLTISDSIAGGTTGIIHIAGAGNVVLGDVRATTIDVDGGSTLSLTGTLTNDSLTVSGSASFVLTKSLQGSGHFGVANFGFLALDVASTVDGGVQLADHGTVELDATNAAGTGHITFAQGAQATLVIDFGFTPTNQIDGFLPGNTIKLAGFGTGANPTLNAVLGAGNVLTVSDGTNSAQLHLTPGVDYSTAQFSIVATNGGVTVTETIAPKITVIGQPQNGNQVLLSGVGIPGSTIQILIDGDQVGTATPDANGHFTFKTAALADGEYSFTATQTGGGQSQTTSLTVDVLPSAPSLALAPGQPLLVNNVGVHVTGVGEANQTITLHLSGPNPATYTTTADGSGNYDFVTPKLGDGNYTLTTTETDGDGVVSNASNVISFTVHPQAPTALAVVGQALDGHTIHVTGTADPGVTVNVFSNSIFIGSGIANSITGIFDFQTAGAVPHGVDTLVATAVDSQGIGSAASSPVTFNVVPQAPVISSVAGHPVNGDLIEVTGSALPGGTVTIYDGNTVIGSVVADRSGVFDLHATAAIADGKHSLTATVTDGSNLTGPLSSPFALNVLPNTPAISTVIATAPQAIEVQGTGEVGEAIKLFDGSTLLGSTEVDQTGHFDFTTNILGGHHVITATETNSDNLTSAISTGFQIEVTPKAPTITTLINHPDASIGIVVKGTGQHVGETINIYADGGSAAIGTGTVAADGSFTITTTALANGSHTLTATDAAGADVSASSAGFDVYVDPAPVTNVSQVGVAADHGAIDLQGSGQAGDAVTLMLGNTVIGTGTADVTGHFDVTTNQAASSLLGPGLQHVTVTQTDSLGHTSPATGFDAKVAPDAPAINSVVSVPDSVGRVEVKGTGDAGTTIKLYADSGSTVIGSGTVDASGHFDVYSDFQSVSAGAHNITAIESIAGIESLASGSASVNVIAAATNTWTITSASDLAKAIAAIDVASAQAGTHYTFNITGDLTLTDQLPAFNLPQGVSLTIAGNHHTLDANGNPGLFVYAGSVEIDDLNINNAITHGGDSDFTGGGGAGLGGGLFIASSGKVTLSDVSFANDKAVGGNALFGIGYIAGGIGGGGGLNGGAGGLVGGGGIGIHASGANTNTFLSSYTPAGLGTAAGAGIVIGEASGGSNSVNSSPIYRGGGSGGGGGQGDGFYSNAALIGPLGYSDGGAGGGIGGAAGGTARDAFGGAGGFGGGGGGGGRDPYTGAGAGGAGGFGGGGGAGRYVAGNGGFGGGGGGGSGFYGAGGFGAGNGTYAVGGGGLGAGGAIFVQQGGTLIFAGSGSEQNDGVTGGVAYGPWTVQSASAYGSGIFLQGDETITFAPDSGHSITLSGAIADMTGSHDHTGQTGTGTLALDGAGTLILFGNNTFTGGVMLEGGTLDVASAHGAGSGAIDFAPGAHATLEIDAGNGAFANAIDGFDASGQIVIDHFQVTSESYNNGVLTLNGASGSLTLTLTHADATLLADFNFAVDPLAGTTTITIPDIATSWTDTGGGAWGTAGSASTDWSSTTHLTPTAADDATIAPGATADYAVSIASGATAFAHNLTINDAHVTLDDAGSLTLSGNLHVDAGSFLLDGGSLETALPITIAGGAMFEGDGTVSAVGASNVSGTVVASVAGGPALDFASAVTGSGNFEIEAGATLEFGGAVTSGASVTFEGGTGELKLDSPQSFSGTIAGFSGTAPDAQHSDVVDLAGIDINSAQFSQSYNATTGVLTASDGTHSTSLTFRGFVGDDSNFHFASDGHGGTLIFDPPAPPAAVASSDSFTFRPGMGAETIRNFDLLHDTIELDHFANAQTMKQLTSLITAGARSDAAIEFGHGDSVTVAGLTPPQLWAAINSDFHLH
jgi:large repetitive protein